MNTSSRFLTRLVFACVSMGCAISLQPSAMSAPCYPTDPTGVNTDNACLQYPPFSTDSPATQGHGFNSGYSAYGQYPPNRNQPVGTRGFWTGVSVDGNTRSITIQDSNGQVNTFLPRVR